VPVEGKAISSRRIIWGIISFSGWGEQSEPISGKTFPAQLSKLYFLPSIARQSSLRSYLSWRRDNMAQQLALHNSRELLLWIYIYAKLFLF